MNPLRVSTLSVLLLSAACSARGGSGVIVSGGDAATSDAGVTSDVTAPPVDLGAPVDVGSPADAPAVDVQEMTCTPGSSVCLDAQTARVCGDDGRTTVSVPCAATGGRCEGGRCTARVCAPGTLQCVSGARQRCSDDGLMYSPLPCPTAPNGVNRCGDTVTCVLSCNEGFRDCNANAADGCEANLRESAAHCGACGNACPSGTMCNGGTCASTCAGLVCSGACIDPSTSVAHCGSCGNACTGRPNATGTCDSGACRLDCVAGFGNCDGSLVTGCETDVRTAAANCGACGVACATGQTCVGGVCTGGGADAASCREIHATRPTAASGVFRIDPDGAGGNAAFDVYCDMTTAGGGWTLAAIISNADAQNWTPRSASWVTTTTFGAPTSPLTNADAKSMAYNVLAADEVLIARPGASPIIDVQTTTNCLRSRTLLSVMSQSSVYSATCALSCNVVTQMAPFPTALSACHAAGLRFRCRDETTTTTANGYSISTDDNSFISSVSNVSTCTAYQSGFGASTGSTYADLDTDLGSGVIATDLTHRLLYVR